MPTAEPIDSTATFTLLKHNASVAELVFCRKIDSQRVRKSLLKRYGKLDKQEQKLLFAGSSAILSLNENEKKYGHILLSALNCFLCFQNARVSVISRASDAEKKPSLNEE